MKAAGKNSFTKAGNNVSDYDSVYRNSIVNFTRLDSDLNKTLEALKSQKNALESEWRKASANLVDKLEQEITFGENKTNQARDKTLRALQDDKSRSEKKLSEMVPDYKKKAQEFLDGASSDLDFAEEAIKQVKLNGLISPAKHSNSGGAESEPDERLLDSSVKELGKLSKTVRRGKNKVQESTKKLQEFRNRRSQIRKNSIFLVIIVMIFFSSYLVKLIFFSENKTEQVVVAGKKLLGTKDFKKTNKDRARNAVAIRKSKDMNLLTASMVLIKGGCFPMGDVFGGGHNKDEKPVHNVCVDNYYLSDHEVTQGEWKKIMGSNPSSFSSCGDDCPVERVSWNDVQRYIRKLNQKKGQNFRLPTEAEWEYAARSGGKREKWAGTSSKALLKDYAWYRSHSGKKTHPVKTKSPNGLRLYDMTGNVWEWVSDRYGEEYYKLSSRSNPKGPSGGSYRVFRGGSWYNNPRGLRASNRGSGSPDSGNSGLGFRLARTP